jgi:hypothetical protein
MQSLTTPPVTSVQPPRTLGRRSPSTSPIILLLGSGRSSHRRPVSTRLPHPLACSARARARPSITTRRPAPPACWPVVVAVPGFSSVVRILQSCGSIFNGRRRRVQKLWPRRRRSCPVSCPSHHQSPPPTDIGRFPQPQLSMAAFATSSTDLFSRHEGAGRRMIWQEDRRNVQVASSCLSGARRDVMRFS